MTKSPFTATGRLTINGQPVEFPITGEVDLPDLPDVPAPPPPDDDPPDPPPDDPPDEQPPETDGAHTHEPIPYRLPNPVGVILADPSTFAQRYRDWTDSPPGTHLILAAGIYQDLPTGRQVIGTAEHPKVIRAADDQVVTLRSSSPKNRHLLHFNPGSAHVQVRGIRFEQAQFHIAWISNRTGESHHLLVADCYFENSWQTSNWCMGHDLTWYNNFWRDCQMNNINGQLGGGWSWCAGSRHYEKPGGNGEMKLPANLSFIYNNLDRCGGEGLILSRSTSGLARGNTIFNAISVCLYAQNSINCTIENNTIGCTEHRFLHVYPNARPRAIAIGTERWQDIPTRNSTDIIIRNNIIKANAGMLKCALEWVARNQDPGAPLGYGGIQILDNVVTGTMTTGKHVIVAKLAGNAPRPGPRNRIRHSGPVDIGDPDYWEVL